MKKILLWVMLLFSLNACSADYIKPAFFYRAPFDPVMINDVETFIREVSEKWNLRVFEKDREQMKFITQGQEAFFIALYHNDNAILDVSNVGAGIVLTLELFDYGEMSLSDLERLSIEVKHGLKEKFGIKLEVAEP